MVKEAALWKASFDIYIGAEGKEITDNPVQDIRPVHTVLIPQYGRNWRIHKSYVSETHD